MKKLIFIVLFFSLNIVGTKPALSEEHVYCNVFLANLCFGIRDGDSYSVQANLDFTMYNITLKNGDSIQIYEGRHPESFDFSSAYVSKNAVNEFSVSAIKTAPLQQRILVEPNAKGIPKSDIFIKLHDNDTSTIRDFLENFKSCSRKKLEVKCRQEPLLNQLQWPAA